jgi:hypothetical protein
MCIDVILNLLESLLLTAYDMISKFRSVAMFVTFYGLKLSAYKCYIHIYGVLIHSYQIP